MSVNENILISVIIPVYNVENYIRRCLDSVVNQTLKNIEIICINDGSTDSSLEILQEYAQKDSRIKILNQNNTGVSASRNNGIDVAQGEFLSFIDSDDWISLDFYEKLYNAAVKYDCDIAASGFTKVKKNKFQKMLSFVEYQVAEECIDKLNLLNCPDYSYVWNKIYRTSEIKKNNLYFKTGITFEDIIFSSKTIYYLNRCVIVPDVQYYYLKREDSILHCGKYKKDNEIALERCKDFLISKNIPIEKVMTVTERYKIFNLTILKTKTRKNKKEITIFNFIKFKINTK